MGCTRDCITVSLRPPTNWRHRPSQQEGGRTLATTQVCTHLELIVNPRPKTKGCEECLKMGDTWVHLRLCEVCGHVGCCDSSKTSTPPSTSTPPAIRSSS